MKYLIISFLFILVMLQAAVIKVESKIGSEIKTKILDEGTAQKNELYYKYRKVLTPTPYQLNKIIGKVALFSDESTTLQPGDMLIDRDWYIIIKLIRSGGDIDLALQETGGEEIDSVFKQVKGMALDQFVSFMESILLKRLNQIKGYISVGEISAEDSSLFLLNIVLGDYYFYLDNDFKKALDYYELGLNMKPEHVLLKSEAYLNAAESAVNLKLYKKALEYYRSAETLLEKSGTKYDEFLKRSKLSIKEVNKILVKSENFRKSIKKKADLSRSVIVKSAQALLGKRWSSGSLYKGKKFYYDCSGTVGRIYWDNGIDISSEFNNPAFRGKNGVYRIYYTYKKQNKIHKVKIPNIGDLIFFNNTFDRNRDGKWNDNLIHIGIVESVDSDGTISFIHHCSKGISRYRMNLYKPTQYKNYKTGKVYNSFLRRKSSKDPKESSYVAANFFAGFATIVGDLP